MEHERDGRAEVLLTGATGFLGKVVLHELLRRRAEFGLSSDLCHGVTIRGPPEPRQPTVRE